MKIAKRTISEECFHYLYYALQGQLKTGSYTFPSQVQSSVELHKPSDQYQNFFFLCSLSLSTRQERSSSSPPPIITVYAPALRDFVNLRLRRTVQGCGFPLRTRSRTNPLALTSQPGWRAQPLHRGPGHRPLPPGFRPPGRPVPLLSRPIPPRGRIAAGSPSYPRLLPPAQRLHPRVHPDGFLHHRRPPSVGQPAAPPLA